MKQEELDLFAFAAENAAAEKRREERMPRALLQQIAFGFIVSLRPDAAAQQVPAKNTRLPAAAAGFWRAVSGRRRPAVRTVLAALCPDLDCCFNDCCGREERLERINAMRVRIAELEARIRREEPHLASADDLFSEFRSWDYASSRNADYHRLRADLGREIRLLTEGGRLERLQQAAVADLCYLVAPAGIAAAAAVLPGWGVVEAGPGHRFRVVREAELQSGVTPENRQQFALNIAQAAAGSARFAAGVELSNSGKVSFRKMPRRRGRVAR